MSAIIGHGTTLKIAGTVTVGVKSVSGPGLSVGTVETSDLSSTWKTFLPTFPDGGELTFSVNFDPSQTTQTALYGLIAAPAVEAIIVTFPGGATAAFTGILTAFAVTGISNEDLITADCTIKVTGAVTFTAAP